MDQFFGKQYYIDFDKIIDKCKTTGVTEDKVKKGKEIEKAPLEINVFKYEMIKMCLDRVINDFQESEDDTILKGLKNEDVSFQIAFNSLIKSEILIEYIEDDE
jgi:hypothetical protein